MKHIDGNRIDDLLDVGVVYDAGRIDGILAKAKELNRLSLEETAALLSVRDAGLTEKIFEAAAYVKNAIYGRRVVLFAPLYISNRCVNKCQYCAFKADNASLERRSLRSEEVIEQVEWLLSRGHKRILMVTGEATRVNGMANIDYYLESIKAIYDAQVGPHKIKRVNVNCAPLSLDEFKLLKGSGIGTYQIFQESYHDETYKLMHPAGPKSDPNNRLDAVDRAFKAGIDDIGVGVLYGLADYRFETLAMLMHIEYLENTYGVGPHTISVPRIEPAEGADFTKNVPNAISDKDFTKLVAVLRLAVPYTGIILSTREEALMRDKLVNLGISQISAESRTAPGGYATEDNNQDHGIQFTLGDQRTLDEIIGSLVKQKYLPSFCAACYRKKRTGEAFMNMARPGNIKGMCQMNGLVTLKEYLDDFGSEQVRKDGYALIEECVENLGSDARQMLDGFFSHIDDGVRDEYV
ncbi:MAG: [FeFe] hydrogenase H-cluster radical SAM maturase HydG [Phycisphaerae bacterium]|nr:[FeFe] hydrogenase H-cluster radical SAM maturase HydG [Phycisphaerae bacterium]